MSILNILAAIASIVLLCSPSLAASDEEMAHVGDKMSGAFRCSTYAGMFHDQKEQQRLFQIGLRAAREGAKALRSDPKFSEMVGDLMPSVDFVAGILWDTETTKAYDEIVKYDNG